MGRIAKYTNFYEDSTFDDDDQKPEEEFNSPIAMKDVPTHEMKKMQMVKTLMDTWDMDCAQMVLYLQRFIFKKYRDMDGPDVDAYDEAVKNFKELRARIKQDSEKKGIM